MRNLREYLWAGSPGEALALLSTHPGRGAFLGGGTALAARQDPGLEFVVDLSQAGMGGISAADGGLEIGAAVSLHDMADDARVRTFGSGVAVEAVRRTRTEPWRRQATVAGRILEADPADLLTPVFQVLGARLRLLHHAERPPELEDLGTALPRILAGTTAAAGPRSDGSGPGRAGASAAGPLVVAVLLPAPEPGWGFALESISRTALDAPLVGVAAGVRMQGTTIAAARIATTALPAPRRAPRVEAALRGATLESMAAALAALEDDVAPVDDWRASAEYRLHAGRALLARAVRAAAEAASVGW